MLRHSLGRLAAVAAVAVPLAAAAGLMVAGAQTPLTITMSPTKGLQPNLTGSTTITSLGNNQFKVDIIVNGLNPNDDRAAHIHKPGTDTSDPNGCDTGGAIVYPLTDVKADASGKGTSTTTVTIDATKGVPTTGWYVNVHQSAGTSIGPGVICGKIATSFATLAGSASGATTSQTATGTPSSQTATGTPSSTTASGGATALPATGTGGPATSHSDLIAVLALAAIALGGTGVVVARRR